MGKNRIVVVSPKPILKKPEVLTSEARVIPCSRQNAGRLSQTFDLDTTAPAWPQPELQQRLADRVPFWVRKGPPLCEARRGPAMEAVKVCPRVTPQGGMSELRGD